MICTWIHGPCTYEFDATSRADELAQVRAICKERGWKFKDFIKTAMKDMVKKEE